MLIPSKFFMEYKKLLCEKHNFPREQWIFLGEKPKFQGRRTPPLGNNLVSLGKNLISRENICYKSFAFIVILFSFLYILMTYHCKGLGEKYNFVIWNISIRIHMQKLRSSKISNTFVPYGKLSSFSPRDMIVPQGKEGLSCSPKQLKPLLPRDMIVPHEKPTSPKKKPKFFKETYVLNFLAITIFSYI